MTTMYTLTLCIIHLTHTTIHTHLIYAHILAMSGNIQYMTTWSYVVNRMWVKGNLSMGTGE